MLKLMNFNHSAKFTCPCVARPSPVMLNGLRSENLDGMAD